MLIFALMHLLMIPIAYLFQAFPFLSQIAESTMGGILNLLEWIQG